MNNEAEKGSFFELPNNNAPENYPQNFMYSSAYPNIYPNSSKNVNPKLVMDSIYKYHGK